jgi:hypothetical protein
MGNWRAILKDIRGLAKAERQCAVCKRWFTRRRDTTCSQACVERDAAGFTDSPMRK